MTHTEVDTLFAGPWTGSLSQELFAWQGMIRKFAKTCKPKRVVVASKAGHEHLYEDFADEFIELSSEYILKHQDFNEKTYNDICSEYSLSNLDRWINPFLTYSKIVAGREESRLSFLPNCSYVKYGKDSDFIKKYDLIIHPKKGDKNWPLEKWSSLIKITGLHTACVGNSSTTHFVEEADDLRDRSLKDICSYISKATMAIGPSSGYMHLSSLCNTPHIVWSDLKEDCDKYELYWNPLKTKVRVLDYSYKRNPPLMAVLKELEIFYDSCSNTL